MPSGCVQRAPEQALRKACCALASAVCRQPGRSMAMKARMVEFWFSGAAGVGIVPSLTLTPNPGIPSPWFLVPYPSPNHFQAHLRGPVAYAVARAWEVELSHLR